MNNKIKKKKRGFLPDSPVAELGFSSGLLIHSLSRTHFPTECARRGLSSSDTQADLNQLWVLESSLLPFQTQRGNPRFSQGGSLFNQLLFVFRTKVEMTQ
jgi:hypothetical protein